MKYVIFFLLIPITLVCAQDIGVEQERRTEIREDTKRVVVSGVGSDRDAAIKQGLRSAVEQAIGVFLKSETVVENYQLISDKILSHSRGYVNSYEVIDEKAESGLYSVTLSAVVIVKQLEATLVELNLYSRPVEGESLFARAATTIAETRSAAALFRDLRSDYPRNAIEVTFGEPDIRTDQSDNVIVTVPYSLRWNRTYLNELAEVLEQTAHDIANTDRDRRAKDSQHSLRDYARIDLGETRYYLPVAAAGELFYRVRGNEYSNLILLAVYVSLDDKDGNSIAAHTQGGRTELLHRVSENYLFFEYATESGSQKHLDQWSRNLKPVQFRGSLDELKQISSVSGYAVDPLRK